MALLFLGTDLDFLVCAFSDLAYVVDVYMDLSWISDEYEILYQVRVLLVVLLSLVFVVMVDAWFKALVGWFLGLFVELVFMGLIVIGIRSEFQVED